MFNEKDVEHKDGIPFFLVQSEATSASISALDLEYRHKILMKTKGEY